MSFGKRTHGSPPPRPGEKTNSLQSAVLPPRASGWRFGKRILGFVAGIAVVALACEGLLRVGRVAEAPLEAPFKFVGTKPPTMALLRTPTAESWRLNGCTMSRPVEVMDSFRDNRFGRRDRFGSDIATEMADQSYFFECLAEVNELALCDSVIRAAFVSDVQKFFADYDGFRTHMISFEADSGANQTIANVMRELSNAHPDLADDMRTPRKAMVEARERVEDTLRIAAADGMITSRDFGFFGNSEIKHLVGNVEVKRSRCVASKM